jgi:excisionase family DNA binding protein
VTRASVAEPIVAAEDERPELKKVEDVLAPAAEERPKLVGPGRRETPIPDSLYQVLLEAVHQLKQGKGVAILPVSAELSTQEAADLLNVSRPHVVKLLETGEIPFHKVGTHRRLQLRDLLTFKARRDHLAKQTLTELVQEAQKLGIYDE